MFIQKKTCVRRIFMETNCVYLKKKLLFNPNQECNEIMGSILVYIYICVLYDYTFN